MTEPKTAVEEVAAAEGEEAPTPEALARATAILTRTLADPLVVAKENAELRSSIKGCYALLQVLVERDGGDAFVSFDEHTNLKGDLEIARTPDGGVSLRVRVPNRAERRAKRK